MKILSNAAMTLAFAILCVAILIPTQAEALLWNCNAMCGRSIQSFFYVYGQGSEAIEAFRQMDRACPPPNALFVGVSGSTPIPATFQNACVKNSCAMEGESQSFDE
jgi:hypothetical protein